MSDTQPDGAERTVELSEAEYLAKTKLSERIADGFEGLFDDAPDDDVTASCRTQLEWEIRHIFRTAGIANEPRPDISTDDLVDFCAVHAGLELLVLHLADQAHAPRIDLASLNPHLAGSE